MSIDKKLYCSTNHCDTDFNFFFAYDSSLVEISIVTKTKFLWYSAVYACFVFGSGCPLLNNHKCVSQTGSIGL